MEWGVGQLVQERGKVVKELVKLMMTGESACHLMTKYYMKPSHKLSVNLGEDHLTVTKIYILITPSLTSSPFTLTTNAQSTTKKPLTTTTLSLLSTSPLSFMF